MRPHCRPSLGSHLLRPPLPLRQLLQLLPLQCPLPLLGSLNTTESDIFQHKLSHTPISPALSINYPIYLDSPSVSVGSLHTFCRLGPTLVVAFSWSWPLPGRLHSVVPLPHHPALYLPVSVRGPWEPWSAHSEAEARSESPEEQSNLSNPWQPGSAHYKHSPSNIWVTPLHCGLQEQRWGSNITPVSIQQPLNILIYQVNITINPSKSNSVLYPSLIKVARTRLADLLANFSTTLL